ncbi:M48 family metallopeptidase [Pseudanabaena yagii]|uniref:M48 family metallopeptidase n=1 Tax=Pseudanabaena yagii GIHE-NHR1 TaxID=2722753 RepID=A0ABX1LXZ2_9CYAN|nr:SprT family zinc-dependent metalloprotease [Pseudanabaena yagii]NMF60103.1 M48 family metallopeptidase [Pseudanabaena yagii GIHE-NHR1]
MGSRSPSLANPINPELPAYTVRISDRAKCVRLALSVDKGLEVVIPKNYDHLKIPELIHQKRDWIIRNQRKLDEREAFLQSQAPHELPDVIKLRSLGEEWQIIYNQTVTKFGSITISEQKEQFQLIISGNVTDTEGCKTLLKQWLMRKAEKHLFSWLRRVSIQINLPYCTTTIRGQKTLWGSCSSDRNISLNYKLLFLETKVVEYVLIHELCHTIHMNHSAKFWNLVSKFEPNYKTLDESLKQAWQIVPAWVGL